ncbi:MAG: serine/threonine protein kinase [Anaerolineales bacterium]|nr:serine/threonine protein kinase [Anaerolineales bacterium]
MAEVYKVWDQQRAVFLAAKVLHDELSKNQAFMKRFKREAQTLAQLEHPSIVRFYSMEQDGRLIFILLDYISGKTLKYWITREGGRLIMDKIRSTMRPICGALQFAHSKGLVHCDVKPNNILIDERGRPLVTDFGIARMADTSIMDLVGTGTPAYMAPEQARGLDPVPQTDIYALGIILFEMLTGGRRPFTGARSQAAGTTGERVRWEQINLPPPSPRRWNADISPELEAVVIKCLAKDPVRRYQTPLEFFYALERCLSASPDSLTTVRTAERTAATRQTKSAWLGVVISAAVLMAALLLVLFSHPSRMPVTHPISEPVGESAPAEPVSTSFAWSTSTPTPANTQLPTSTFWSTITSPPQLLTQILFQDNFSDPSSGWDRVTVAEGITDYENGYYRIFVNTNNTDIWANPGLNFADVRIEVDAIKVGGSDDNDFGIICRYQDAENFYLFIISSDGYYGIGKVIGGKQILLDMPQMQFSSGIRQGSVSAQIRADCIGKQLALYVDGKHIHSVEDGTFISGDVGLIAGTFSETGTDIYFDNFVVRNP